MLCEHMRKFAAEYASGSVHVSAIDVDVADADDVGLWCEEFECGGAEATNAEWQAFLTGPVPSPEMEVAVG